MALLLTTFGERARFPDARGARGSLLRLSRARTVSSPRDIAEREPHHPVRVRARVRPERTAPRLRRSASRGCRPRAPRSGAREKGAARPRPCGRRRRRRPRACTRRGSAPRPSAAGRARRARSPIAETKSSRVRPAAAPRVQRLPRGGKLRVARERGAGEERGKRMLLRNGKRGAAPERFVPAVARDARGGFFFEG